MSYNIVYVSLVKKKKKCYQNFFEILGVHTTGSLLLFYYNTCTHFPKYCH